MAKKRGPDGTPVDVPTHLDRPAPSPHPAHGDDAETDPPPVRRTSLFPEEAPTQPPGTPVAKQSGAHSPPPFTAADENRTVIQGGRRHAALETEGLDDPVAGWLVIVDGPGVGSVLTVGQGQNSIGRAATQRISIDFGDAEISREHHAAIIYDPRGRQFLMQQGSGKNLVYLDDDLVLSPTRIESGQEMLLGQTRLRFVALCGPDFSWQDR